MKNANGQKTKPVPGHKCKGVSIGVKVTCECGFTAGPWFGEGAKANAYSEWRYHVAKHAQEKADT